MIIKHVPLKKSNMCAKVRQLAHGMFLGFITITAPASQDVIQFGSGHLLIAEGKRPALETRGDDRVLSP